MAFPTRLVISSLILLVVVISGFKIYRMIQMLKMITLNAIKDILNDPTNIDKLWHLLNIDPTASLEDKKTALVSTLQSSGFGSTVIQSLQRLAFP